MLDPQLSPRMLEIDASRPLDFEWDEWSTRKYFYFARVNDRVQIAQLSTRARQALALAVCEWIQRRFEGHHSRDVPEQYIMAGWAALIDPSYSEFYQISWEDWRGPVLGPLAISLGIACAVLYNNSDEPDASWVACYALNLARHVLSDRESFEAWLAESLTRLCTYHSRDGAVSEDILSTNFRCGVMVSRFIFNEQTAYDPRTTLADHMQFVSAHRGGNPFLHLPNHFQAG